MRYFMRRHKKASDSSEFLLFVMESAHDTRCGWNGNHSKRLWNVRGFVSRLSFAYNLAGMGSSMRCPYIYRIYMTCLRPKSLRLLIGFVIDFVNFFQKIQNLATATSYCS